MAARHRTVDQSGLTYNVGSFNVTTTEDIASISWTVAAGATNACVFTGTLKDSNGDTIESVRSFLVYISEAATGLGVTADNFSTGVSISDGTGVEMLSEKVYLVQTGTDGVFALTITDTNEPADQYMVAILPDGSLSISDASSTNWGA